MHRLIYESFFSKDKLTMEKACWGGEERVGGVTERATDNGILKPSEQRE